MYNDFIFVVLCQEREKGPKHGFGYISHMSIVMVLQKTKVG